MEGKKRGSETAGYSTIPTFEIPARNRDEVRSPLNFLPYYKRGLFSSDCKTALLAALNTTFPLHVDVIHTRKHKQGSNIGGTTRPSGRQLTCQGEEQYVNEDDEGQGKEEVDDHDEGTCSSEAASSGAEFFKKGSPDELVQQLAGILDEHFSPRALLVTRDRFIAHGERHKIGYETLDNPHVDAVRLYFMPSDTYFVPSAVVSDGSRSSPSMEYDDWVQNLSAVEIAWSDLGRDGKRVLEVEEVPQDSSIGETIILDLKTCNRVVKGDKAATWCFSSILPLLRKTPVATVVLGWNGSSDDGAGVLLAPNFPKEFVEQLNLLFGSAFPPLPDKQIAFVHTRHLGGSASIPLRKYDVIVRVDLRPAGQAHSCLMSGKDQFYSMRLRNGLPEILSDAPVHVYSSVRKQAGPSVRARLNNPLVPKCIVAPANRTLQSLGIRNVQCLLKVDALDQTVVDRMTSKSALCHWFLVIHTSATFDIQSPLSGLHVLIIAERVDKAQYRERNNNFLCIIDGLRDAGAIVDDVLSEDRLTLLGAHAIDRTSEATVHDISNLLLDVAERSSEDNNSEQLMQYASDWLRKGLQLQRPMYDHQLARGWDTLRLAVGAVQREWRRTVRTGCVQTLWMQKLFSASGCTTLMLMTAYMLKDSGVVVRILPTENIDEALSAIKDNPVTCGVVFVVNPEQSAIDRLSRCMARCKTLFVVERRVTPATVSWDNHFLVSPFVDESCFPDVFRSVRKLSHHCLARTHEGTEERHRASLDDRHIQSVVEHGLGERTKPMENEVEDMWESAGEVEKKNLILHAFCRLFCGMVPGDQFCSNLRLPQLVAPYTTAFFRAEARVPNRVLWRLLVTAGVIKHVPTSPADIVSLLASVLGAAVDLSMDVAKLVFSVFESQVDANLSLFLCFSLFLLNDRREVNSPAKFLKDLFDLIESYCGKAYKMMWEHVYVQCSRMLRRIDPKLSVTVALRALTVAPGSYIAHGNAGECFLSSAQYESALRHLTKAQSGAAGEDRDRLASHIDYVHELINNDEEGIGGPSDIRRPSAGQEPKMIESDALLFTPTRLSKSVKVEQPFPDLQTALALYFRYF